MASIQESASIDIVVIWAWAVVSEHGTNSAPECEDGGNPKSDEESVVVGDEEPECDTGDEAEERGD